MTALTAAELAAMGQRARLATGLKWLTADDTKRLDALAADVAALLAYVHALEAERAVGVQVAAVIAAGDGERLVLAEHPELGKVWRVE